MDDDNVNPTNTNDDDAPFSSPYPEADERISTHPETDTDVDNQEYYDEGLVGVTELDKEVIGEDDDIPEGFHVE